VSIEDSLKRWSKAGIPRLKLMMGIGGYAICYGGEVTAPRQPTSAGSITGGDDAFPLADVFAKGGALDRYPGSRVWDSTAQQPYLSLPAGAHSDAHCGNDAARYLPYDDEQSIVAKGRWSRSHHYGGTIVWTVQQLWLPATGTGGRPKNALMTALHDGFIAV
jgi:chitinase